MIPKRQFERPLHSREGEWDGKKAVFYTNRIIVKLKPRPDAGEGAAAETVEAVRRVLPNAIVIRPPKATGRVVFGIDPGADLSRLIEDLRSRDDVEYAEPDIIDRAQVIPTDTRYIDQWGLPKMNAPAAWDLETGSAAGVLIGVIDSGISMSAGGALDHPDLNQAGRYILGTDFVDGGTPRDLNGHGTHVAGIAAAESNNAQGVCGMNWNTPVYVCRTLDANGNGSSADFADAVEEIVDYAVAHGLKVAINYSGGGGANLTKQNACQYASDRGMILCAAVGNDYGGPVIWPAAYSTMFDGVVAVGSTNADDTVSDFSNVGPEVTVVAPGRNILSTMPTYPVGIPAALNYDYLDGTSMATPYVTGLVALMWSRHSSFTNKKIKDCLTGTAVKLGAGNFSNSWGYGRVDAEKALRCGDISFTRLTRFTRFTALTRLTQLTTFTRFTRFTQLTMLTRLTRLTRFTPFTSLTRFTRLVPYTRFTPATRFPEPGPGPVIRPTPFIRFGNTVFAPEELEVSRFDELHGVAGELEAAGIASVDGLAASDPGEVGDALGLAPEDADRLVNLAQALLRRLVEE